MAKDCNQFEHKNRKGSYIILVKMQKQMVDFLNKIAYNLNHNI